LDGWAPLNNETTQIRKRTERKIRGNILSGKNNESLEKLGKKKKIGGGGGGKGG